MGGAAYENDDNPTALRHYRRAEGIYRALPADSLPPLQRDYRRLLVLTNLALVYGDLRQYALATRLCRQALALRAPVGADYRNRVAGTQLALATLYLKARQPDSARLSAQRGLRLVSRPEKEADLRSRLAEADLAQGRPEAARRQLLEALRLARRGNFEVTIHDCLELLAAALHQLRRPEAFDTLRRFLALHDTLYSQERVAAQVEAVARFEADEQQAQIRELEQARRLAAQTRELTRLRTQRQLGLGGALLLLLLAGGGALLWGYRRRQARRETSLRTQIAADLHDDVGTLLSQISLQSQVLQACLFQTDPAGQQRQLGQIGEASPSAVRQLNDVVWSLDAHNDTLPQLLDRLHDYTHEALHPLGVPVGFEVPAQVPARHLSLAVRRNLYLIYKEALHNVLKHAPATAGVVVVVALPAAGSLVLSIENEAPAAGTIAGAAPRRSGHGLRNMAARAAALGGSATAGPRPGGGFGVRVVVPV